MLAVHRILPTDAYQVGLTVPEKKIVDGYDMVEKFAKDARGKAIAFVEAGVSRSIAYISEIGYVPHNPDGPLLRYSLEDSDVLGGWVRMIISNHKHYSREPGEKGTDMESGIDIAYALNDLSSPHGSMSTFIDDFAVGIDEIYARRPNDYRQREAETRYVAVLDEARQGFPNFIK